MAKLSIGSWAYTFGPYEDHPIPFDVVVKKLNELEYDGVEIGAFKPHIHPEDYPMKSDRDAVKKFIAKNPAVKKFFEVFNLPLADINQQNTRMNGGEKSQKDIERHVDEWIEKNPAKWSGWITEARKAAK